MPTMYHPTTRVLAVLELLRTHGRIGGPEIARRLEVSERTVRQYVTMLQDLGIPVEGERGRYGAYKLRPGYKLPPLMLTEDEALALTLGLLAARRLGLGADAASVEGALAKVERVMPEALRERVGAVQQTLALDLCPPQAVPDNAVVVLLGGAARDGRRVRLRYRSWKGEETERLVDPYGLAYHGGRWFAAGHCHLRGDVRVFRLDRVLRAERSGEAFAPPEGFDTLEHVTRSLATTPNGWYVEALLRTTLEEARQAVSPSLAALDAVPEGVVLRCYMTDLDWMARILAGLWCTVEVREPPELRDALVRFAERVAALAAGDANGAGRSTGAVSKMRPGDGDAG